MRHTLRKIAFGGVLIFAGAAAAVAQVSDDVVKVGVLTDMTGAYSDLSGPGSLIAAQMAAEDFGGKVLGKPIVIISADHQNKPDIASSIARKWFDEEHVDAIADLVTSSTALAVMPVAAEKKRITLVSGAASSAIEGDKCTAYNVHYTYNTYAMAAGTGRAVVQKGGKTWFFITADYVFGKSLEADTSKVVIASGGKILGGVKAPFPTTDFSSYLLQAQASGAQIVGLANAGADTINAIKQANDSASPRSSPWLAFSSFSRTSTVSASPRRRGCISPPPSIGIATKKAASGRSGFSSVIRRCRRWSRPASTPR